MSEIKEHVVLDTKDLDKARAIRAAISAKFNGRRLWVCIINSEGSHKVTVADNWGGRLSEEDAKPVLDFTQKRASKVTARKEMS